MSDEERELRGEAGLADPVYAEGFAYLYTLLSHLTSSKLLFVHKLLVLMELSSQVARGSFTRAEMEAMFPQYAPRVMESIVHSLIDGTWLVREEGTLRYTLSKAGLLALRFFPFLYRGDEMEELAFQQALADIFQAAEQMQLHMRSLEMLRDQAIHAIQRNIAEIRSALISRNTERIREAREKMNQFIQNIEQLLGRLGQIAEWKRSTDGEEPDAKDKQALDVLLQLQEQIQELFTQQHKALSETLTVGSAQFTKADMDRFLYHQSFYQLAGYTEDIGYTPSNAKWVDEDDIVVALNVFLQRVKQIRKRTFSPRVYGRKEEAGLRAEPSYLDKVQASLRLALADRDKVPLADFVFQQQTKTDVLMYLAALCFMDGQLLYDNREGQAFTGFRLEVGKRAERYENQWFRILSAGDIVRKDVPHGRA